MITSISGNSADEVWLQAASLFKNHTSFEIQPSRAGDTEEILHVCFTINNPRQRWVLSRTPTINPAFALAEVVWIINGSNDATIINHWNPILPKFAGNNTKYPGAYGFRLRVHYGIDQLERAYQALINNPHTSPTSTVNLKLKKV